MWVVLFMMDRSARALLGLAVLLVPSLCGQHQQKPSFDKYHVVPYGSRGPGTIAGGQYVSILGWHLTPDPWCNAPHQQDSRFPFEICGVRVLVGGRPAGLMYAGPMGNRALDADQINFQVPSDVDAEGEVPVQVCVGTMCSDPLNVPFTKKDILLRLEQKAYVHMPLWLEFKIPLNPDFVYPVSPCPWDFGGFRIEVRKDGQVVPSSPMPMCPDVNPVRTLTARSLSRGARRSLPAHLFHIFHTPGLYELRMSGPLLTPDLGRVSRTGYSDWIPVNVESFSDAERQAWLEAVVALTRKGNNRRHHSELIISLMAQPDEKALNALLDLLSPPIRPDLPTGNRLWSGGFRMNWAQDCLAPAALAAFPESLLKKHIAPERLAKLQQRPAYCQSH